MSRAAKWLLALLVVFGLSGAFLLGRPAVNAAINLDDCKSARTLLTSAVQRGDKLEAQYRQQEIELICGSGAAESTPTPTPTPTPTQTPTPTSPPTPAPEPPTPSVEEFLANRPAETKETINSYGPLVAVLPELNGKLMYDLDADEAFKEHVYVVDKVDRMQTASAEVTLGLWRQGDVNARTEQFVQNRAVWDEAKAKVVEKLTSMNREIVFIKVWTPVEVTYSVPGEIPQIGWDSTEFSYDTPWLVYTDPATGQKYQFKLNCHFQPGGSIYIPAMPAPAPGMSRTPEGEPVPAPNPTPSPTPTPTPAPKDPAKDVNANPGVDEVAKNNDGSAEVNNNNGAQDSQGLQNDPAADAAKAETKAAQDAAKAEANHEAVQSVAATEGGGKVDAETHTESAPTPGW